MGHSVYIQFKLISLNVTLTLKFSSLLPVIRRPGSSVGIATGYGLDSPGIESRWGRDFPHMTRPALGPTQPPVQLVPALIPGVKSGRSVTLTPHPLLVAWSRKGRAIPVLPLWAVRPVQSLSACTRVHFTLPQCLYKGTLYLTSVPVQGCTLPFLPYL